MTDQVRYQRKVFHLLGLLQKHINVMVLQYDMTDQCRSAMIRKLDNVKGSLVESDINKEGFSMLD